MTRSSAIALAQPSRAPHLVSREPAKLALVPVRVSDVGAIIRACIAELIGRYHNPSTIIADAAVEAASAGRPAFWKRTGYSNSTVGLVCSDVNMGVPLAEALERWTKFNSAHGTRAAILAELIPLNAGAENELTSLR